MRKFLLLFTLALLISFSSFGQSWTYSEGGSAFDGKYKISSVKGKGTNFPYNNPTLVINKFEGEQLNFYISEGGFFQEQTGIGVLWVFDNEPDTIYSTFDWSISSDGKILFFKEFNNPDGSSTKLKPIEIIEKLTLANKVTVRMEDKYGSNDIVFSLSGSTKAINSVIGKENIKLLLQKPKQEKLKLKIEKEKELSLMKSNEAVLKKLLSTADSEMLTSKSIENLKLQFKKDLGLGTRKSFATNLNYKTIKVKRAPNKSDIIFKDFGNVEIYYILENEEEIKIDGSWRVQRGAPIYKRLLIN